MICFLPACSPPPASKSRTRCLPSHTPPAARIARRVQRLPELALTGRALAQRHIRHLIALERHILKLAIVARRVSSPPPDAVQSIAQPPRIQSRACTASPSPNSVSQYAASCSTSVTASAARRSPCPPPRPPPVAVVPPLYCPAQGISRGHDSTERTSRTPDASPSPPPPAAPHAPRTIPGKKSSAAASAQSHGHPSAATGTSAGRTPPTARGSSHPTHPLGTLYLDFEIGVHRPPPSSAVSTGGLRPSPSDPLRPLRRAIAPPRSHLAQSRFYPYGACLAMATHFFRSSISSGIRWDLSDIEQGAKFSNRALLLREECRALSNPMHADDSVDPINYFFGVLWTEFVVIAFEPGRRWTIPNHSPQASKERRWTAMAQVLTYKPVAQTSLLCNSDVKEIGPRVLRISLKGGFRRHVLSISIKIA